jgi:hypothetical protein
MQHYTSIEQSKKLVELGLNPDTADMYYFCDPTPAGNVMHPTLIIVEKHLHSRLPEYDKGDIPCWSLGALLELMPKVISVPVDKRSAYFYNLEWQFANDNSLRYITTNRDKCLVDIYSNHDIGSKPLIKTAFEMICWLLENNYIKKGE